MMPARPLQPAPATDLAWETARQRLELAGRPLLMGIVNVTPDSFSDGGRFYRVEEAVERGLQLVEHGADILDIGGESTRPYAAVVDESEELQRVVPVIRELARQCDIPISIDTSKSRVAAAALDAGAAIINDVTGLEGDAGMIDVARQSGAGLCVMHMQGTPQTMQDNPRYDDVVREVAAYLAARRDSLIDRGIPQQRICLDPGIGFGKTHEHNLQLLHRLDAILELNCPTLVGHSRKGFLGKIINDKTADRTAATIGVGLAAALQGVHVLRVHDVQPMRHAWLGFQAALG